MPATPSYNQRKLGQMLRDIRKEARIGMEDAAERCGWDKSKISRVENAKIGFTRHDLAKLAAVLGADEETVARLEELREDPDRVPWWRDYNDLLVGSYEALITLEHQAARITTAGSGLFPGLLQSPDYARATMEQSAFVPDPDDVDALVMIRRRRQEILTGETPVMYEAILSEALLQMELGGRDVLRGQLTHLLDLGDLDNVELRILPFAARAGAIVGEVTVMDFPDPRDPSVVYVEYQAGAVFKDTERDVRRYRRDLAHVRAAASSPTESRELIADRLGEL